MRSARRTHTRRGVAHIELALLMPFLLLFLYAIMEYSWVFYQRTAVQEAGRQGCRHGATLNEQDHDVEGEVVAHTLATLTSLGVDCDVRTCAIAVDYEGVYPTRRLRCSVDIDYRPLTNALPIPERVSVGYLYLFEVQ